jgi:hypothetical protein
MLRLTKYDLGLEVSGIYSITYEFVFRFYRYVPRTLEPGLRNMPAVFLSGGHVCSGRTVPDQATG